MEWELQYLPVRLARGVHVRCWNFAVIVILFSFSGADAASELIESSSPKLVIKAPLTADREALITVTETTTTSPEQIYEIISSAETRNSDILVSTDQELVLEAAVQATSKPNDKRLLRLIPIGKLASASQKIASGFNAYYARAKHTVMHDRIGLTVLTITVGFDSMIWIHSASLDIHQKTSMVLMNLVMAASFGLDRDLWTKMTGPLKNKLINVFDRFLVSDRLSSVKVLASQFLSNFAFGVAVQTVRTGLLSLDHISDAVMTADYWMTAAKIGGLFTLTAFAWTELYGGIDSGKNPVAKMTMKRIGELRWLILSQLASISMVLQPHVYGQLPIITFIVHGTVGLIVLANGERIIRFLEANALVNRVYRKVQSFEHFINEGLQVGSRNRPIRTCHSLFSN